MGIDAAVHHGVGDPFVSEHSADFGQGSTVVQERFGKRMAKHIGTITGKGVAKAGLEQAPDDIADGHRVAGLYRGFRSQKDFVVSNGGTHGDVIPQGGQRLSGDGELDDGAIFSGIEQHGRGFPVDVREFEFGDFAGAKTVMGQKKKNGKISFFDQCGPTKAVQKRLKFGPGDVFGPGVRAIAVWANHIGGQIMGILSVQEEKAKKRAQGRDDMTDRPETDASGEILEVVIDGCDSDIGQAFDTAVFKIGSKTHEFPRSDEGRDAMESSVVTAPHGILIEERIGNDKAVCSGRRLSERLAGLCESKSQESFDLVAVIPKIDFRHVALILQTESPMDMTEISRQKSRCHVRPGAFGMDEPVIEASVFKANASECCPVKLLIEKALQIQLPIGGPTRKQIKERFGCLRLIKNLAQGTPISGISTGVREPRERHFNCWIDGEQAALDGIAAEAARLVEN